MKLVFLVKAGTGTFVVIGFDEVKGDFWPNLLFQY